MLSLPLSFLFSLLILQLSDLVQELNFHLVDCLVNGLFPLIFASRLYFTNLILHQLLNLLFLFLKFLPDGCFLVTVWLFQSFNFFFPSLDLNLQLLVSLARCLSWLFKKLVNFTLLELQLLLHQLQLLPDLNGLLLAGIWFNKFLLVLLLEQPNSFWELCFKLVPSFNNLKTLSFDMLCFNFKLIWFKLELSHHLLLQHFNFGATFGLGLLELFNNGCGLYQLFFSELQCLLLLL